MSADEIATSSRRFKLDYYAFSGTRIQKKSVSKPYLDYHASVGAWESDAGPIHAHSATGHNSQRLPTVTLMCRAEIHA